MKEYLFLSTSPAWGTTPAWGGSRCTQRISIHVPRVGDDKTQYGTIFAVKISIHVPRVGDDA